MDDLLLLLVGNGGTTAASSLPSGPTTSNIMDEPSLATSCPRGASDGRATASSSTEVPSTCGVMGEPIFGVGDGCAARARGFAPTAVQTSSPPAAGDRQFSNAVEVESDCAPTEVEGDDAPTEPADSGCDDVPEWNEFGGDGRMNGSCDGGSEPARGRSRSRYTRRRRGRTSHQVVQGLQSAVVAPAMWFTRFESFGSACRHMLAPQEDDGRRHMVSMLGGDVTFDQALSRTRASMLSLLRSSGASFYIGTTENPNRHFQEHSESGVPWTRMLVLVEASHSGVTANLERSLLSEFGERVNCTNASRGGERASAGSPHYLYILLNDSGLTRRCGNRHTEVWP